MKVIFTDPFLQKPKYKKEDSFLNRQKDARTAFEQFAPLPQNNEMLYSSPSLSFVLAIQNGNQ